MASVFGIRIHLDQGREDGFEAEEMSIRGRRRRRAIEETDAITVDERYSRVGTDDAKGGVVPECAGGSDRGRPKRRQSHRRRHAHGSRQEHVVHVARVGGTQRRDRRRGTVEGVAERHGASMREVGDPVCDVDGAQSTRQRVDRVSDAGEGRQRGVRNIREPNPLDQSFGPYRRRRMPCDFERPVRIPEAFVAVGQVGIRRDADGVVDGDVAPNGRG